MTTKITAIDLYAKINNGEKFTIIDVRDADRYNTFHLPGAINLEKGFVIENIQQIFANKKSYITCNSGNSAGMIAKLAGEQGLDVTSLDGGMNLLINHLEDTNKG